MKKISFILLVLVFTSNLIAQKKGEWRIGLNYTSFGLVPIFEDSKNGDGESLLNHKFGIDVYLRLSKYLELKSGIKYSQFDFRQELYVDIPAIFCESSQASVDPEEIFNVKYDDEYTVKYIGVPFELKYFFSETYKSLYAKLGIEVLSLVQDKLWLSEVFASHDCTPPLKLEFNEFIYNLGVGIGYEVSVSEKINILVEPNINITINTLFKGPRQSQYEIRSIVNNNTRILDFGVLLGVKF